MPKFYFHIDQGSRDEIDAVGVEFKCFELAVPDARSCAGEMLPERIANGEVVGEPVFEITDEVGLLLATIPFQSVLRLH